MSDSLAAVGDTWERLARVDALWAVLSEPDKQGNRWDLDDFLRTGEEEISALLADLAVFGPVPTGSALDFGCGVGRLSLPLSTRFERVTGVDIAPTMIEKATALGQGRPGLSFVVNQRPDLSFVESASIDLVYSNIVLQHMEPEVARVYIREFYRIVTHGGFVVFQIPSHLTQEWLPDARNGTVLADELRDAAITVVDAPVQLAVGERADVVVRVRNVSGGVWYQDLTNQINVANHWLGVDGEVVVHDDGRARLPGRMQAGERADVVLRVRAPSIAGTYLLELDVVQEGTAWFAQHGSTTARWPVRVVDAAAPANGTGADAAGDTSGGADSAATASAGHVAAADPAPEYPTFMMRGIPRDDVEQLVRDLGGEILDAREHVTEWVSYRYVTRRTG